MQVQNVTRYLDIIYTCAASNGHETINDYERRHHDIRIRVRCELLTQNLCLVRAVISKGVLLPSSKASKNLTLDLCHLPLLTF